MSSMVSWEEVLAMRAVVRDSRWERALRPFWRARREWAPRYVVRKLQWGCQRWRRGFSDRDVWNADHHLARIIPPMMRQLSRDLHGVPGFIYAKHDEDMDAAVAEWGEILWPPGSRRGRRLARSTRAAIGSRSWRRSGAGARVC